jgi:hypothetical protein
MILEKSRLEQEEMEALEGLEARVGAALLLATPAPTVSAAAAVVR